ncbi:MAG TPA: hypothetical protein VK172_06710 [Lentimicrobium sp.]|nr:hypothetical protein [Lentimicrobium sp.]
MKRFLSEIEDLSWLPHWLRRYLTDYLQFIFRHFNLYAPVTSFLHDILIQTRQKQLVDLCSGSGGPLLQIRKDYFRKYGSVPSILLTDKYPNTVLNKLLAPGIMYNPDPVDAKSIPENLKGVRTMFSSLHHFSLPELAQILKDAVAKKQPVAFFDSGDKNIFFIIGIIIIHPILLILLTPFIKPFSFGRLIFTYIFPLVIIGAVWDGVVSIIHLHSFSSLKNLIDNHELNKFQWKIIKLKNKLGMSINSLIGIPLNTISK